MRRLPLALGAVLLVSSGAVTGHEGATGVVKERMDDMKAIAAATKRVGDRLKAGRDLAGIAADADRIASAADRMPALFPAGSHGGHSEATPAVWKRRSDFDASSRALADASRMLAEAARAGKGAEASAQLRAVTRSCGECHDAFRARR